MTDTDYGPNGTEVARYIAALPGLTFAQWGKLRNPQRSRDLARRSVERMAGDNPAINKAWINAWLATQAACRNAPGFGFDIWSEVMDTTLALVFRDMISGDQFDQLTAPMNGIGGVL